MRFKLVLLALMAFMSIGITTTLVMTSPAMAQRQPDRGDDGGGSEDCESPECNPQPCVGAECDPPPCIPGVNCDPCPPTIACPPPCVGPVVHPDCPPPCVGPNCGPCVGDDCGDPDPCVGPDCDPPGPCVGPNCNPPVDCVVNCGPGGGIPGNKVGLQRCDAKLGELKKVTVQQINSIRGRDTVDVVPVCADKNLIEQQEGVGNIRAAIAKNKIMDAALDGYGTSADYVVGVVVGRTQAVLYVHIR